MVVVAIAPLVAHLPLATMAALLFVVAWGLIEVREMRRIVDTSRGEALVLGLTFVSTLALQLEFAIFIGVLASLFVYLNRTTHPQLTEGRRSGRHRHCRFRVRAVSPACAARSSRPARRRFAVLRRGRARARRARCRKESPASRCILLTSSGIHFFGVAGGELLVQEARRAEESGGVLFVTSLKRAVRSALERGGFLEGIGRERIFVTKDEAIRAIYPTLDSAICRVCAARIFNECHVTLPDGTPRVDESIGFVR